MTPRRILNVLIVDDEPGMCKGAQRVLESYSVPLGDAEGEVGFRIDSCESGAAFLSQLSKAAPDIILLDCKLPDIDGIELLDRLSRRKIDALTIMITAYATLDTAVRATKLGAHDFLAKPFTPEELRYTVGKAVRDIMLIRKSRLLAEEKRQIRFQFISMLAHELKSPLNAVQGYLDMILNGHVEYTQSRLGDVCRRGVKRIGGMRRMIDDLLDLTRIESGQKARRLDEVNVAEAAQGIVDLTASVAAEGGITVRLSADPRAVMTADRGEIDMMIGNLVSNAIKYNRRGGSVDISVTNDAASPCIRISDTGIGMTNEETERLFEEFFRVKNEKTRGISGSGLGLSIVKKLVDLYGGTIRVTSAPDEGSCFEIRLPENRGRS